MTLELHENPNILVPMNLWSPNFNNGSNKYVQIFVIKILISIYYVLHI
jgi:hypothetical protein